MGRASCAAVYSAWMEYMLEPSPMSAMVRPFKPMRWRPSARPTAAGMP